ncbi:hypothetical protein BRC88_08730 [Halobacteriales archaeon QS_4_69_225]|nr:MAG: hypothetical protein BRC88_08730 [Halobacteriales archaeon QS_4_69_225]
MRRTRRPRRAVGPVAAPLRSAAVAAALVAGFLGPLVAVVHPVPAVAALGGVVGAADSRLRLRRRLGLRRVAGETSGKEVGDTAGEDATDLSAVQSASSSSSTPGASVGSTSSGSSVPPVTMPSSVST